VVRGETAEPAVAEEVRPTVAGVSDHPCRPGPNGEHDGRAHARESRVGRACAPDGGIGLSDGVPDTVLERPSRGAGPAPQRGSPPRSGSRSPRREGRPRPSVTRRPPRRVGTDRVLVRAPPPPPVRQPGSSRHTPSHRAHEGEMEMVLFEHAGVRPRGPAGSGLRRRRPCRSRGPSSPGARAASSGRRGRRPGRTPGRAWPCRSLALFVRPEEECPERVPELPEPVAVGKRAVERLEAACRERVTDPDEHLPKTKRYRAIIRGSGELRWEPEAAGAGQQVLEPGRRGEEDHKADAEDEADAYHRGLGNGLCRDHDAERRVTSAVGSANATGGKRTWRRRIERPKGRMTPTRSR